MTDKQIQAMADQYARSLMTGGKEPQTVYEKGAVRMWASAFYGGYRMALVDERDRVRKLKRKR